MNRQEHMDWSKSRAKEILASGDISGAYASMVSDLGKHAETADHAAIGLGMMLMMGGHLSSCAEMEKFIDGFN
jgi:hypothetical protein